MEKNLQVLLSYSHQQPQLRDALRQFISKLGHCDVRCDQDEGYNHPTPPDLMEKMVQECDVAIFLLTDDDAQGVFDEMRFWRQHHSPEFHDAVVFRDFRVRSDLHQKIGFNPTHVPFSATNPFVDIHAIVPAIENLIKRGFAKPKFLPWQLVCHNIRRDYDWKIIANKVPIDRIEEVLSLIAGKVKYADPTKWRFRISWHTESSNIDSYSEKIHCLDLLMALLQTEARTDEYDSIFKAIKRLVESGQEEPPPKKLLGKILFSGCSIATVQELQHTLGDHPYEKNADFIERRLSHSAKVPQSPKSLLLPKEILAGGNNLETFLESQKLILRAVSEVCKYVDCSTIEITASHSFVMTNEHEKGEPLLAMACTATRTNKDTLSAISEVPIIMAGPASAIDDTENLVWYGQPYKPPTSEFRSHWLYHCRSAPRRVKKNLLMHFHPIELVDIYRRVFDGNKDGRIHTTIEELIQYIPVKFTNAGIDFHVDTNYKDHSSRFAEFGMFMRGQVQDEAAGCSVIWKPNHGFWAFFDDNHCSDEILINSLIALDEISLSAARAFKDLLTGRELRLKNST